MNESKIKATASKLVDEMFTDDDFAAEGRWSRSGRQDRIESAMRELLTSFARDVRVRGLEIYNGIGCFDTPGDWLALDEVAKEYGIQEEGE